MEKPSSPSSSQLWVKFSSQGLNPTPSFSREPPAAGPFGALGYQVGSPSSAGPAPAHLKGTGIREIKGEKSPEWKEQQQAGRSFFPLIPPEGRAAGPERRQIALAPLTPAISLPCAQNPKSQRRAAVPAARSGAGNGAGSCCSTAPGRQKGNSTEPEPGQHLASLCNRRRCRRAPTSSSAFLSSDPRCSPLLSAVAFYWLCTKKRSLIKQSFRL